MGIVWCDAVAFGDAGVGSGYDFNVAEEDGGSDITYDEEKSRLLRGESVAFWKGKKIWGDGRQTRSFLYISDAVEGTIKLMESDYSKPINVGSDREGLLKTYNWLENELKKTTHNL